MSRRAGNDKRFTIAALTWISEPGDARLAAMVQVHGPEKALDREAIRESMALAFAGPLKDTSIYSKQLSIRFVGSDVAIAVTESGILFPGQAEVPDEGKVNASWLFEKQDGHWLITACHNSPVVALGQCFISSKETGTRSHAPVAVSPGSGGRI